MPIFCLSGALFPFAGLLVALSVVTSLDPRAYRIDGLRAAFIASSHVGPAWTQPRSPRRPR
jgi:ABC-2 type transport system permease protein